MVYSNTTKWTLTYKPLVVFSCLAALCATMVFNSLTQYLNQDEEQFITAAYLAQHMRLYADFLYLQSPIYPLILSKLLMLFSGVSPFLIARLLSAVLAIGTVVVFFRLAARLSESVPFAFILASLFASAPLMLRAYGMTRNDIMPIFFGLCGVWFVLCSLSVEREQRRRFLGLFLGGVCMALAVGAKVTAAFIPLSALLYIFLRARPQLLPFVLGGAIGSLPIVYYAATAYDKFIYCNAVFHLTIRNEFYTDLGQAEILTWPYRVKSVALTWFSEPTLVVAILFVAFVIFIGWCRGLQFRTIGKHLLADRIFIILLVPAAMPFVFLPESIWLALPRSLRCRMYCSVARRYIRWRKQFWSVGRCSFSLRWLSSCSHCRLNNLWPDNSSTAQLWTVAEVQDLSALIARYVKGGTVATLYPANSA